MVSMHSSQSLDAIALRPVTWATEQQIGWFRTRHDGAKRLDSLGWHLTQELNDAIAHRIECRVACSAP
jgi:hypothetical protein